MVSGSIATLKSGVSVTSCEHSSSSQQTTTQCSQIPTLSKVPFQDPHRVFDTSVTQKTSSGFPADKGTVNSAGDREGDKVEEADMNGLDVSKTVTGGAEWMVHDRALVMSPRNSQKLDQGQQSQKNPLNFDLQEPIVLLKPEDFLKRPVTQVNSFTFGSEAPFLPYDQHLERKNMKQAVKTYVNSDSNPTCLPAMMNEKLKDRHSSQPDFCEEEAGSARHFSDNRFPPHEFSHYGILHDKGSDGSDTMALHDTANNQEMSFFSARMQTPEEEIVDIRDRLQNFISQKQKLRLALSDVLNILVVICFI